MRNLTMQLPENIWSRAREYEKFLTLTGTSSVKPVELNESDMFCLLDVISAGKVSTKKSIELQNSSGPFSSPSL